MSHQTGIKANEGLLKAFSKCKQNKTRLVKVSILNEELTLAAQHDAKRDWQADYDTLIGPLIQPTTPSYLLYRLDAKNTLGHIWLLITWVPEAAPIRQKMLYASTKATLKTEFGSAYIKEEIHATTAAEVTLDGYHRHKAAHNSPAPLTLREEELLEIRQNELNCSGGIGAGGGGGGVGAVVHTPTGLGGIHCPMTAPAEQAIVDMLRGSYNYLQFSIELQREQIELVKAGQVEPVAALQREVPADHARYHLYLFRHTHEGDYEESFVFVYSMPGYNCPVKERMMYSSCKAPFVEAIERLGVVVAKKLEIDDAAELTEDFLQDELHPKKILHRPVFAKPKGPPNRGAKRMTRPQAAAE